MADLQPLANLKDIHLPKAIGVWPIAPGWYGLAGIVLLGLLWFLYKLYRKHMNKQFKRRALRLLAEYNVQYRLRGQTQEISAKVTELLKQVALIYFPRSRVAGLKGDNWITFLNETSKNLDFNSVRYCMLELPYKKKTQDIDLEPLFYCTQAWIKQRDVSCSN